MQIQIWPRPLVFAYVVDRYRAISLNIANGSILRMTSSMTSSYWHILRTGNRCYCAVLIGTFATGVHYLSFKCKIMAFSSHFAHIKFSKHRPAILFFSCWFVIKNQHQRKCDVKTYNVFFRYYVCLYNVIKFVIIDFISIISTKRNK